MTSQMWRRLAPAAILLLGLALFLLFGLERYFSFEMLSRHHAIGTRTGEPGLTSVAARRDGGRS